MMLFHAYMPIMYPLILGCAGEKPYVCEYCDARFSHQTHLVVHTRRHTGDRPYKCSLCEASYARKNLLVIHIRKHTGELHSAMLQDKFTCSYSYAQNMVLGCCKPDVSLCHLLFWTRLCKNLLRKMSITFIWAWNKVLVTETSESGIQLQAKLTRCGLVQSLTLITFVISKKTHSCVLCHGGPDSQMGQHRWEQYIAANSHYVYASQQCYVHF